MCFLLQDCISSLCRWLSVHGWAESVKSVATPTDLRTRVGHSESHSDIHVHVVFSVCCTLLQNKGGPFNYYT